MWLANFIITLIVSESIIVLTISSFLICSIFLEKVLGCTSARRNYRYSFFAALVCFSYIIITSLLRDDFVSLFIEQYRWINFTTLSCTGIVIWLISTIVAKHQSGVLLIDLGKTKEHKWMSWASLAGIAMAIFNSYMFWMTWMMTSYYGDGKVYIFLGIEVPRLIFFWLIALSCVAASLNKLQFRGKGICFVWFFVRWQQVESYFWNTAVDDPEKEAHQEKSDLLTVRFTPSFLLLPEFIFKNVVISFRMIIPQQQYDMVSQILEEQLPDKKLLSSNRIKYPSGN